MHDLREQRASERTLGELTSGAVGRYGDLPGAGKSPIWLSSPSAKNIFISFQPKSPAYFGCLIPHEGALAIVTNVGMGCGGRGRAFDEQRVMRTAKSCGPDAPMLASSR
jgi:hypothetical protein